MYAVCSTKKEDVARAIHEMVKNGQKIPIFQFGAKKYSELEKNQYTTPAACKKVEKEAIYVINLNTRKIHKKTCGCKGNNVVGARLCNINATGLLLCMNCMK